MAIRKTTLGEIVSTYFKVGPSGEIHEHITWGFPTRRETAANLRLQTVRELNDAGRAWESGEFPVLAAAE